MKECFKCKSYLPLEEFYRHPKMADGRLGKCKSCARSDVAHNYRERRQQYIEYERKRFKDATRKKKAIEYAASGRRRSPEKSIARQRTARAIKSGKLLPRPCKVCGGKNVQAHHSDYSRPLDITWLCYAHHMEAHGKIGTAKPRTVYRATDGVID